MTGQDVLNTIEFLVPPIITLLAGYIGIRYGLKQIHAQKRLDFIKQQLEEFYSPLLGLHKEIRAKSNLRVKVQNVSHEIWKEMSDEERSESIEQVDNEIAYDNMQLDKEFIPMYREMLRIFKTKYWLAEKETRQYYAELVEYVEGWNRVKEGGVTGEALVKLGHTEENPKPFYQELEKRTDILRNELAKKD